MTRQYYYRGARPEPRPRSSRSARAPVGNPVRKKREFSQGHVIFADFLVLLVYAVSAGLAFFDKQPLSDVGITIVSIYGAFATGGYFTLCAVRDTSWNRHCGGAKGERGKTAETASERTGELETVNGRGERYGDDVR